MDFIKEWGQIAGIGGLALGVFLFLFREVIRKKIFTSLTKKQSFITIIIFMILVWSIAGFCIYTYQILNNTSMQTTNTAQKDYKPLNRSYLLGIESAIAMALSNKEENPENEIIRINEWLRELDINYRIDSKKFNEENLQSIIKFINPKGESYMYSFLLGFYSFVCDNTPEVCHQQFDLTIWFSKSMLRKTGYKGDSTNLKSFLSEMRIYSEKVLQ